MTVSYRTSGVVSAPAERDPDVPKLCVLTNLSLTKVALMTSSPLTFAAITEDPIERYLFVWAVR